MKVGKLCARQRDRQRALGQEALVGKDGHSCGTDDKTGAGSIAEKAAPPQALNKITISDITEDCGVNRMTFYYHFKDIYDLVDWILMEDAAEALEGLQDFETWSGALREMLEKVQANRVLVLNVYRSVSREQVEQYLYKMLDPLLRIFVERLNIPVKEEDKQFIIDFYKYGFVGLALEWIRRDMKTDPAIMAERLNTIMQGDLKRALQRFRTDGKASIETD